MQATSTVRVPLRPKLDVSADLMVKILVGAPTSKVYHVFDIELKVPKFMMYVPESLNNISGPSSSVSLSIHERASRILLWMNTVFGAEVVAQSEVQS